MSNLNEFLLYAKIQKIILLIILILSLTTIGIKIYKDLNKTEKEKIRELYVREYGTENFDSIHNFMVNEKHEFFVNGNYIFTVKENQKRIMIIRKLNEIMDIFDDKTLTDEPWPYEREYNK